MQRMVIILDLDTFSKKPQLPGTGDPLYQPFINFVKLMAGVCQPEGKVSVIG